MDADKRRWGMVRKAGKGLLLACVILMVSGVWWFCFSSSPTAIIKRYSLMERKGEEGAENSRKMETELVRCGPKAVPVLVEEIKKGYWTRGRLGFPRALAGIGKSGKDALVAAIDAEKDPMKQIYLIAALHDAYDDHSRIDTFFQACRKLAGNEFIIGRAMKQVFGAFMTKDSPAFTAGKGLNEEFVEWWSKNQPVSTSKG